MRKILGLATIILMSASLALAAEKTWMGRISDSKCGRSHKSTVEHSGQTLDDADCVKACIKDGAKYVFVTTHGKVYNIDNQDFAGLVEHAGHMVKVTGAMTGDTVRVSGIRMPSKSS